jgi:uridine kinase
MNILTIIRSSALAFAKEKGRKYVVIGIAGAGCLGKTTLCYKFRDLVGHYKCQVVSLDGYMLEHEKRKQLGGITGYDPRGFELARARSDISQLTHHKRSFTLYRYDRCIHQKISPELIRHRNFILIEGSLALSSFLHDLEDLHIFLDAHRKIQFKLRLERERREFGYTFSQVARRFEKYWRDYQRFVQPQIERADLIIRIGANFNYKITNSLRN